MRIYQLFHHHLRIYFPLSYLIMPLIALTASNEEAQRFYKHVPDSILRDTGIWIDV